MTTPTLSGLTLLWCRRLQRTSLLALLVTSTLVSAATTDIASAPVATSRTATVKSNIMVLMDTSNSMAWTHMPDEMEGTSLIPPDKLSVGYKSAQCNALYYDPNRTYKLPVDSTGSNLSAATFTAARYNYYSNDTTTVDLSSAFRAYDRNTRRKTSPSGATGANEDPAQQAYYYKYTGTDTLDTSSTSPCMATDILSPGSSGTISTANGTWQRVLVSSTSGPGATDERQNFANWYQYYRTRLALVKSGIGLAFSTVSDAYRVGLITMNPGTPVSSSYYEQLGDFTTAKRSSWYSKLYSQTAQNSSPAREALARVGRHYASKTDGINQGMPDPNPNNYSCQQNFTIMTTDGYWNTAAETVGPVGLDGTTWVGQQDGTLTTASGNTPRPIWDGGTGGSRITTDVSNLYSYATCSTGLFNKTVTDLSRRDTVTRQTSTYVTQATFQKLKTNYTATQQQTSTARTATQRLMTQTRITQVRTQWNDRTVQNLQTDQYYTVTTRRMQKDVYTTAMQTVQIARQTRQTTMGQVNYNQTTYQTTRKTTNITRSSSQNTQTTTTWPRTPYQTTITTRQVSKTTSQTQKTQTQQYQRTSQVFQYDGTTEQTTAVASCTPGGNISCATETTGPTLVASCTQQTASSSNNYLGITCSTTTTFATAFVNPTGSGCPAGTTAASSGTWTDPASSSNSYTTTVCTTTVTGPTVVDPTTCTANVSPSSSNSYTTTTCQTTNSTPTYTAVASCPSGTSATTANTWVENASSSNGWTRKSCTTTQGTVYNGPSAGCSTSTGGAPDYITTTCTSSPVSTGVQTCPSNQTADASNNYTQISCVTTNPGTQGAIAPSTIGTVCPSGTSATPSSTTNYTQTASSSNSWINITCTVTVASGFVDVAGGTCPTGASATTVGSWNATGTTTPFTRTDCSTVKVSGPTVVAPCTVGTTNSGSPNFISTVCAMNTVVTSGTAINPTTVGSTCPTGASASTNGTWTTATPTSPNYYVTTCTTATSATTYVNPASIGTSCPSGQSTTGNDTREQAPTASPWQTIICTTTVAGDTTTAVNPTTCTGANATTAGTTTTYSSNMQYKCTTAVTTTSAVDPSTCTASGPTSANGWKTTTCNYVTVSGPTRVASCANQAPSLANGWIETICTNNVNTYAVATCVAASPTSPNFVTSTCPAPNVADTLVATCTNASATSANNYTSHTCSKTIDETTFVASCTQQTAAAGNSFIGITCTTNYIKNGSNVDINALPVDPSTCTANVAASSGNNYITTTCTNQNSGTQGNIDPSTVASQCPNGASASTNGTWTQAPTSPNWISLSCTTTVTNPVSVNPANTTSCPSGTVSVVGNVSTNTRAAASGNSWVKNVCVTTYQTATPVQSTTCTTNVVPNAGNSWVGYNCSDNNTSQVVDPTTCTVANTAESSGNSWTRTTCTQSYTKNSSNVDFNNLAVDPTTCTANVSPSSGNGWVTTTCTTTTTAPYAVTTCSNAAASSSNGWTATACTSTVTGPDQVSSCTASSVNNTTYQRITTCDAVPGVKLQYTPTRTVTTDVLSGGLVVGTTQTQVVGSAADATGVCLVASAAPGLPSPNPKRPSTSELPAPDVSGCTAWPCVQTYTNVAGGSKNSLADVAQYYYVTDLRPDLEDNVSRLGQGPEDDRLTSQHMTTFVMGLGVSGTLAYDKNYKSSATGAIANIRNGTSNWPVWPSPDTNLFPQASNGNYNDQLLYNDKRSIDDFWHTAINGRGQYFSAADPDSVIEGIRNALSAIGALSGAATAATTSTLTPVEGDNSSFVAGFTTEKWIGDLAAYEIDIDTGEYSLAPRWTAAAKLSAQVGQACDNRKIYVGGSGTLASFSWNSFACDSNGAPTGTATTELSSANQNYFNSTVIQGLSQYSPTNTDGNTGSSTQTANAPGANLVNFIRGQRQYEGFAPNNTKLYRSRETILGDIVNSQPTYLPAPSFSYADDGYSTFKVANAGRVPMIFVGANDGMLHAFYAPKSTDTANAQLAGKEAWAVIPSAVLPNLYKLADYQYSDRHTWYVDSTPVIGDVYDGTSWKTILVGGLGGGGKSYYALQLNHTAANPGAAPTGLWEFKQSDTCFDPSPTAAPQYTDCNLGYTFGRPVITKYTNPAGDSQWVVLLTSGYNNVRSPAGSGDGGGYLYILDALTGRILHKLSTGAGSATSPSGLREINTFVTNVLANNQTLRVYGADILGNLWRFDINDNLGVAGREAVKVGQALDPDGNPQPITTRPAIVEYTGKTMVVVATGRLLGLTDLTSTQTQSLYAIPDALGSTVQYTNFRETLKPMAFTQATTSSNQKYRTIACTGTDAQCATPLGWYVDLSDSGERVNVDSQIIQGTLIVASNVPQSSECNVGGYSWLTQLNVLNGKSIDGVASVFKASGIAGLGAFTVTSGTKLSVTTTSGTVYNELPKWNPPPPAGKRVSWREIVLESQTTP
jgi:Tfp pilus tip-associated adhesin PilY1